MADVTAQGYAVRALAAGEAFARVDALADLFVECVDAGASLSFLPPLAPEKARAFWREVADGVGAGDRTLLVAEDPATGEVLGTVQVLFAWQENQPHRGEVAKMLVRPAARRRGIGEALMRAAEAAARAAGRTLLTLDTYTGSDAERLYTRLGWTRVGEIPQYAVDASGALGATTIFYKRV